jgi:hypoxanthine phosphoribosyltransferase
MMPSFEDFEPLFPADAIKERVLALGREISADLADSENLVVVCVLKGAHVFMSDLIRYLPHNVTCDFLRLSSYQGGTQSTGNVRFDFDLTQPIKGKDVLIVEDIVDTGLSMHFLLKALSARDPRSLKICTLLDKPARRRREVPITYTGFQIENRFVIGYGLDLEGRYRNLPYVAALNVAKQAELDASSEDAVHVKG